MRAAVTRSIRSNLHKYLRSYPRWHFAPPRTQVQCTLQRLGSDYGGYATDVSELQPDSVVYSLGVGLDVSWDFGLIKQCGVTIHAFDPTPRVKEWLGSQDVPAEFRFHELGIGDFDGEGVFHLPLRSDCISHSLIEAPEYSREIIRVPVLRLVTAMRLLGHSKLDILKIDVEGAEYAVLEDLIRERILVRQILVEFHHRISSQGVAKTRRALALLNDYGMKICYVCPRLEIFTLVRVG